MPQAASASSEPADAGAAALSLNHASCSQLHPLMQHSHSSLNNTVAATVIAQDVDAIKVSASSFFLTKSAFMEIALITWCTDVH